MKTYVKTYETFKKSEIVYAGESKDGAYSAKIDATDELLEVGNGKYKTEVWENGKIVGRISNKGEFIQDDMYIYLEELPEGYIGYISDKDLNMIEGQGDQNIRRGGTRKSTIAILRYLGMHRYGFCDFEILEGTEEKEKLKRKWKGVDK